MFSARNKKFKNPSTQQTAFDEKAETVPMRLNRQKGKYQAIARQTSHSPLEQKTERKTFARQKRKLDTQWLETSSKQENITRFFTQIKRAKQRYNPEPEKTEKQASIESKQDSLSLADYFNQFLAIHQNQNLTPQNAIQLTNIFLKFWLQAPRDICEWGQIWQIIQTLHQQTDLQVIGADFQKHILQCVEARPQDRPLCFLGYYQEILDEKKPIAQLEKSFTHFLNNCYANFSLSTKKQLSYQDFRLELLHHFFENASADNFAFSVLSLKNLFANAVPDQKTEMQTDSRAKTKLMANLKRIEKIIATIPDELEKPRFSPLIKSLLSSVWLFPNSLCNTPFLLDIISNATRSLAQLMAELISDNTYIILLLQSLDLATSPVNQACCYARLLEVYAYQLKEWGTARNYFNLLEKYCQDNPQDERVLNALCDLFECGEDCEETEGQSLDNDISKLVDSLTLNDSDTLTESTPGFSL